jgi:hypothetical protein
MKRGVNTTIARMRDQRPISAQRPIGPIRSTTRDVWSQRSVEPFRGGGGAMRMSFATWVLSPCAGVGGGSRRRRHRRTDG